VIPQLSNWTEGRLARLFRAGKPGVQMKKLLILLCLCAPAWGAIAFVGSGSVDQTGSATCSSNGSGNLALTWIVGAFADHTVKAFTFTVGTARNANITNAVATVEAHVGDNTAGTVSVSMASTNWTGVAVELRTQASRPPPAGTHRRVSAVTD
jgi:hypothetical protein